MKLQKQKIPFTQVANEVLNSKNLSWKAKGIYAYLFSKPEGWDFSGDRIKQDGSEGRFAVFTTLKELEKAGYLERTRLASGKVEYRIKYSSPMTETSNGESKPDDGYCKVQKPPLAITSSISNKEDPSNKEVESNKDSADEPAQVDEVAEIIHAFEGINPAVKKMYGNITQRKACQAMIKEYGFQETLRCINEVLPKTNSMAFFPTLTTPLQLEEGWTKLKAAVAKYKNKEIKKKTVIV